MHLANRHRKGYLSACFSFYCCQDNYSVAYNLLKQVFIIFVIVIMSSFSSVFHKMLQQILIKNHGNLKCEASFEYFYFTQSLYNLNCSPVKFKICSALST
jgi:hypothetical protein